MSSVNSVLSSGVCLLLCSGHVHICLCGLSDNVNW